MKKRALYHAPETKDYVIKKDANVKKSKLQKKYSTIHIHIQYYRRIERKNA